jgi:1-acyl-sn-glycerol-3-phosphate acyltransferase
MNLLRSLAFALAFYVAGTLVVLSAGVCALASRRGARFGGRYWSAFFLWSAAHLAGVRLRLVGQLPKGPVIVALKHQSAFETIATLRIFDWPAVVMKAELMQIPVWGWIARRHGSIPVDRDGSSAAMRLMLRIAERAIAEGREIVIFPEGTRTAVGDAPPLKPGVAGLYRLLKLPVVPATLDSGLFWPRRQFLKRPGTITIRFGAPIPPGLDRRTFEARLHAAINETP